MRLAISTTNVRLNFVISPGLDVLPSNMVYIKDSPGYNNILLVSNSKMSFGTNNVNSIMKASLPPPKSTEIVEKKSTENKKTAVSTIKSAPSQRNVPILLSAGLIAFLARYVWVAVL